MRPGYSLSTSSRLVLEESEAIALRMRHSFVTSQHILFSLLSTKESDPVQEILTIVGLNVGKLRKKIKEQIKETTVLKSMEPKFSPKIKEIVTCAAVEAAAMGTRVVEPYHLLLGILVKETGLANNILKQADISIDNLRAEIITYVYPDNTVLATPDPQPKKTPTKNLTTT